jgi:hypothetical protein
MQLKIGGIGLYLLVMLFGISFTSILRIADVIGYLGFSVFTAVLSFVASILLLMVLDSKQIGG